MLQRRGIVQPHRQGSCLNPCRRSTQQVRAAIAGAMADAAALLGPSEAARLLRKPLLAALADEAPAVCEAALGGLAPLLGALGGAEERLREAVGVELHSMLAQAQVRWLGLHRKANKPSQQRHRRQNLLPAQPADLPGPGEPRRQLARPAGARARVPGAAGAAAGRRGARPLGALRPGPAGVGWVPLREPRQGAGLCLAALRMLVWGWAAAAQVRCTANHSRARAPASAAHPGAASVKPAAAAGLAAFLRAARRERARTELYCRAVRELARGRGCWARLGWLEFAAAAARRFSARFFKVCLAKQPRRPLGAAAAACCHPALWHPCNAPPWCFAHRASPPRRRPSRPDRATSWT
jgi:hypothetical protein